MGEALKEGFPQQNQTAESGTESVNAVELGGRSAVSRDCGDTATGADGSQLGPTDQIVRYLKAIGYIALAVKGDNDTSGC